MLEWETHSWGYRAVPIDTSTTATSAELRERVQAYLTERPWSSTNVVTTEVQGNARRIRHELSVGPYDQANGPRGATLWANLIGKVEDEVVDLVPRSEDEVDEVGVNPQ